jgi:guanidinopropionase
MDFEANLARLVAKYDGENELKTYNPRFAELANKIRDPKGTRALPYAGVATFVGAPYHPIDWAAPDLGDLQVAILGIPMDLGVTNRSGSRFGPRAVRQVERIGPYNHVLDVMPIRELRVADVGDMPFRSRYTLEGCHEDIFAQASRIVAAGVAPLTVGGDHSISLQLLKAVAGRHGPVGMVHIDAHADTSGPYDQTKFHHGGPFRQAVLEGALDPTKTIQIGIRGSAEIFYEFSLDSGMTVIHAEEIEAMGVPAVIAKALEVVGDGPTYVSFDIDSLDPAFAPGTGTPEIGGLTTREAQAILRGLKGLNIVGGDMVEVAPQYDATTNTAHAGAQILFEILSLMAFSPSIAR